MDVKHQVSFAQFNRTRLDLPSRFLNNVLQLPRRKVRTKKDLSCQNTFQTKIIYTSIKTNKHFMVQQNVA